MSGSDFKFHEAEGPALGYYYQGLFALLVLFEQDGDEAAVAIEQFDDIELRSDGQKLMYQLKHSVLEDPPKLSLSSIALWRTLKAWIDILSSVPVEQTQFHLICVAAIQDNSPLMVLTDEGSDREGLLTALREEAARVLKERNDAAAAKQNLPHKGRYRACEALLDIPVTTLRNLLRQATIVSGSPDINGIEDRIAQQLTILPQDQRATIAQRLVEWWERQIIYSLSGKRSRLVHKTELQDQVSILVAELERDRLVPEFTSILPPDDYEPDGMLARQIQLVGGTEHDLKLAIREEWRAREQRSRWVNENPGRQATVAGYDGILIEQWSDRFYASKEECGEDEDELCAAGRTLLRWTHHEAPTTIQPIEEGWQPPYYVRGSYQVLAITLNVGWHPEFQDRLSDEDCG